MHRREKHRQENSSRRPREASDRFVLGAGIRQLESTGLAKAANATEGRTIQIATGSHRASRVIPVCSTAFSIVIIYIFILLLR